MKLVTKLKRAPNKGVWAFFIGVFAFLCFLNAVFPTQSDDMGCKIGGLSAAVGSFNDWNGRIGELMRVAFGSYFATTIWWAPFNALFGTLVIFLCFPAVFGRFPTASFKDISVLSVLITLLLVDKQFSFGSFFFWAAGSFNYITAWFMLLLWGLPYRFYWQAVFGGAKQTEQKASNRNSKNATLFKTVFVILTGFFAGWASEIVIVFILLQCVALFYAYFLRKISLPIWYFCGVLSILAGWLILYTCPGTAGRIRGLLAVGADYHSLKEILFTSTEFFFRIIYQTYQRESIVVLYKEILVLLSLFLGVTTFLERPSKKMVCISFFLVAFLAVSVFLLPRVLFLPMMISLLFMYARYFRKTNAYVSRLYTIFALILMSLFLFIAATVQIDLPQRARFQYALINFVLVSIIMSYCFAFFAEKIKIQKIAFICCCVVAIFSVAAVSAECLRMRLKWGAMFTSIESQKKSGSKNIVVDKATFESRWWSYGDWGNPDEKTDTWVNERYAKVFGVETFVAK